MILIIVIASDQITYPLEILRRKKGGLKYFTPRWDLFAGCLSKLACFNRPISENVFTD